MTKKSRPTQKARAKAAAKNNPGPTKKVLGYGDDQLDPKTLTATPDNVEIENPDLRKRMLERRVVELANENQQLQMAVLEGQVKIGQNNLLMDAIISQAEKEGLELEFEFAAPPAIHDGPPTG